MAAMPVSLSSAEITDTLCHIILISEILTLKLLVFIPTLLLLLLSCFLSDSVRPHRRQPTRLPCPWDSPGKNTGVGCHFLLQCMKVKSESQVTQSCPTLSDPSDCSLTRLLCPWDFPGKSTGVGCHCLLHPHLRNDNYETCH